MLGSRLAAAYLAEVRATYLFGGLLSYAALRVGY